MAPGTACSTGNSVQHREQNAQSLKWEQALEEAECGEAEGLAMRLEGVQERGTGGAYIGGRRDAPLCGVQGPGSWTGTVGLALHLQVTQGLAGLSTWGGES